MPLHPLTNFEIVLVLNMFLKKLKNLLKIKTSKLTFLEYNQVIQQRVDTFELDSLILSLLAKIYSF